MGIGRVDGWGVIRHRDAAFFRRDELPRDPLDFFRDDRVAERADAGGGTSSVQPRGNPMYHSHHVGFNRPPSAVNRPSPLVAETPLRL